MLAKPYRKVSGDLLAAPCQLMLVGAGQIFTHSPVAHPCKGVNESASSTYDGAPTANVTCNADGFWPLLLPTDAHR